jgi:hypothetical protein
VGAGLGMRFPAQISVDATRVAQALVRKTHAARVASTPPAGKTQHGPGNPVSRRRSMIRGTGAVIYDDLRKYF